MRFRALEQEEQGRAAGPFNSLLMRFRGRRLIVGHEDHRGAFNSLLMRFQEGAGEAEGGERGPAFNSLLMRFPMPSQPLREEDIKLSILSS